jgi:hypothetical protein
LCSLSDDEQNRPHYLNLDFSNFVMASAVWLS